MMLSVERLREVLRLDTATGLLYWRERDSNPFNARFAGRQAINTAHGGGYRAGCVDGQCVLAHRVVYALHSGAWPSGEIDHINGDRTDNRPLNLRDVTRLENTRNRAKSSRTKNRHLGVYQRGESWQATICLGGKSICLGTFHTCEDAIAARKAAERQAGFHSNHGRILLKLSKKRVSA